MLIFLIIYQKVDEMKVREKASVVVPGIDDVHKNSNKNTCYHCKKQGHNVRSCKIRVCPYNTSL